MAMAPSFLSKPCPPPPSSCSSSVCPRHRLCCLSLRSPSLLSHPLFSSHSLGCPCPWKDLARPASFLPPVTAYDPSDFAARNGGGAPPQVGASQSLGTVSSPENRSLDAEPEEKFCVPKLARIPPAFAADGTPEATELDLEIYATNSMEGFEPPEEPLPPFGGVFEEYWGEQIGEDYLPKTEKRSSLLAYLDTINATKAAIANGEDLNTTPFKSTTLRRNRPFEPTRANRPFRSRLNRPIQEPKPVDSYWNLKSSESPYNNSVDFTKPETYTGETLYERMKRTSKNKDSASPTETTSSAGGIEENQSDSSTNVRAETNSSTAGSVSDSRDDSELGWLTGKGTEYKGETLYERMKRTSKDKPPTEKSSSTARSEGNQTDSSMNVGSTQQQTQTKSSTSGRESDTSELDWLLKKDSTVYKGETLYERMKRMNKNKDPSLQTTAGSEGNQTNISRNVGSPQQQTQPKSSESDTSELDWLLKKDSTVYKGETMYERMKRMNKNKDPSSQTEKSSSMGVSEGNQTDSSRNVGSTQQQTQMKASTSGRESDTSELGWLLGKDTEYKGETMYERMKRMNKNKDSSAQTEKSSSTGAMGASESNQSDSSRNVGNTQQTQIKSSTSGRDSDTSELGWLLGKNTEYKGETMYERMKRMGKNKDSSVQTEKSSSTGGSESNQFDSSRNVGSMQQTSTSGHESDTSELGWLLGKDREYKGETMYERMKGMGNNKGSSSPTEKKSSTTGSEGNPSQSSTNVNSTLQTEAYSSTGGSEGNQSDSSRNVVSTLQARSQDNKDGSEDNQANRSRNVDNQHNQYDSSRNAYGTSTTKRNTNMAGSQYDSSRNVIDASPTERNIVLDGSQYNGSRNVQDTLPTESIERGSMLQGSSQTGSRDAEDAERNILGKGNSVHWDSFADAKVYSGNTTFGRKTAFNEDRIVDVELVESDRVSGETNEKGGMEGVAATDAYHTKPYAGNTTFGRKVVFNEDRIVDVELVERDKVFGETNKNGGMEGVADAYHAKPYAGNTTFGRKTAFNEDRIVDVELVERDKVFEEPNERGGMEGGAARGAYHREGNILGKRNALDSMPRDSFADAKSFTENIPRDIAVNEDCVKPDTMFGKRNLSSPTEDVVARDSYHAERDILGKSNNSMPQDSIVDAKSSAGNTTLGRNTAFNEDQGLDGSSPRAPETVLHSSNLSRVRNESSGKPGGIMWGATRPIDFETSKGAADRRVAGRGVTSPIHFQTSGTVASGGVVERKDMSLQFSEVTGVSGDSKDLNTVADLAISANDHKRDIETSGVVPDRMEAGWQVSDVVAQVPRLKEGDIALGAGASMSGNDQKYGFESSGRVADRKEPGWQFSEVTQQVSDSKDKNIVFDKAVSRNAEKLDLETLGPVADGKEAGWQSLEVKVQVPEPKDADFVRDSHIPEDDQKPGFGSSESLSDQKEAEWQNQKVTTQFSEPKEMNTVPYTANPGHGQKHGFETVETSADGKAVGWQSSEVTAQFYEPQDMDIVLGAVISGNDQKLDLEIGSEHPGLLLLKDLRPFPETDTDNPFFKLPSSNGSEDVEEFVAPVQKSLIVEDTAVYNGAGAFLWGSGVDVGTVITAEVQGRTVGDGRAILSVRSVARRIAWQRLNQLNQWSQAIDIQITQWNDGGLLGILEGIRAFLPRSEMLKRPESAASVREYVGRTLPVLITRIEEESSNLIVSELKAWTRENLRLGTLHHAIVTKVHSFGMQVEVENTRVRGFVHVSNISKEFVRQVGDLFTEGEKVKVMVIRGREPQQISFSTAELESERGLILRDKECVFNEAEEMAKIFRESLSEQDRQVFGEVIEDTKLEFENPVIANMNWLQLGDKISL